MTDAPMKFPDRRHRAALRKAGVVVEYDTEQRGWKGTPIHIYVGFRKAARA